VHRPGAGGAQALLQFLDPHGGKKVVIDPSA
jgi:hypothetical protein